MAFNSSIFIAAFTLFYLFYILFAHKVNSRVWLLLVFNSVFYWMLSGYGIIVLYALGISDYLISKKIHKTAGENEKKRWLYLSLIINIGLLLTFRHFTQWFHLYEIPFWITVAGISFFVFRSMGYVLDVYRENIEEPESRADIYLAYIGFFPLILQGPISAARDFLVELKSEFIPANIQSGKAFFLLCSGIIKKFWIANFLSANFSDRVFDNPHLFTGMENFFAAIAQALIVYMDFSGYTDMMLAFGLLLGFNLSENFNFPYVSANITEYWRRWHMSLSKWLNEYLFFPLSFAMRRYKTTGTIIAVFITFVISGFWHGTSLNYTFWGMLHGFALIWDILTSGMRRNIQTKIPAPIYQGISVLLTFMFLVFSGIYFRQENMGMANEMILRIFTDRDWSIFGQWLNDFAIVFAVIINSLILHWIFPDVYNSLQLAFNKAGWVLQSLLLAAVIFIGWQISGLEPIPFIYQKF